MLKRLSVFLSVMIGLLKENCFSLQILPCLYHHTIATASSIVWEYLMIHCLVSLKGGPFCPAFCPAMCQFGTFSSGCEFWFLPLQMVRVHREDRQEPADAASQLCSCILSAGRRGSQLRLSPAEFLRLRLDVYPKMLQLLLHDHGLRHSKSDCVLSFLPELFLQGSVQCQD